MTDLTKLNAAQLKVLTLDAIRSNDSAAIARITAEAKRRAAQHVANGTATSELNAAVARLDRA